MPSPDLADRAAALLSLTASTEERSLSQLTELAASQVGGCVAANVAIWRHGELTARASSHPEASRLVDAELASGRGPLLEAIAGDGPVSCPDTLTEERWPEFAQAALRVGIRSCVVLTYRSQALTTLTLFGVGPRAIDPDQLQLGELLMAYGGALVRAVADYGDSRRLAAQLRDAASARAVVDPAKGILMHALGCTADDALERMREVSKRTGLRATEVAQRIIDARVIPAEPISSPSRRPPSRVRLRTPASRSRGDPGAVLDRLAAGTEPPARRNDGIPGRR